MLEDEVEHQVTLEEEEWVAKDSLSSMASLLAKTGWTAPAR